jgi:hypothetical protein
MEVESVEAILVFFICLSVVSNENSRVTGVGDLSYHINRLQSGGVLKFLIIQLAAERERGYMCFSSLEVASTKEA